MRPDWRWRDQFVLNSAVCSADFFSCVNGPIHDLVSVLGMDFFQYKCRHLHQRVGEHKHSVTVPSISFKNIT